MYYLLFMNILRIGNMTNVERGPFNLDVVERDLRGRPNILILMYVCVYVCVYIYIYIYREREMYMYISLLLVVVV